MIKLPLTLHLWGIALLEHTLGCTLGRASTTLATARAERTWRRRDERGSVTIEQVIWAGAVIVIVGVVVAAITAFVKSESGKIK